MKMYLMNAMKKAPIHILFWFLVWFFFKSFFSVGSKNEDFIFWFATILSITAIISSYIMAYYLIPNYLFKKRYRLFGLYVIYLLIGVLFVVEITVLIGFTYYFNLEYHTMPNLTRSFPVMIVCILLIISLFGGVKLIKHNYKTLEKNKSLENKFLQTQLQLKDQELKFLKMQIHPHFLFNSLNTIYGFALKKSEEAPEMILKLSNLLDYILYQIDKPYVLLEDELLHLEDYISLEKMRFRDTLEVSFDHAFQRSNYKIAPMLLIPFVENAFKHGAMIEGLLKVKIKGYESDEQLIFEVVNSSKKNDTTKGIGLDNIRRRLEMLYNEAHTLDIDEGVSHFKTSLSISLKALKEK